MKLGCVATAAAVWLVAGCPGDDPASDSGASSDGSGTADGSGPDGSGGANGSGGPTTATGAGPSTAADTGMSADSGSTAATTDPTTGGTAVTGGLVCDLNQPDVCAECQHEKCCDLLMFCAMDSDCLCVAECTGMTGLPGVAGCLGDCGVNGAPPGFEPLQECMTLACPDADECSAG